MNTIFALSMAVFIYCVAYMLFFSIFKERIILLQRMGEIFQPSENRDDETDRPFGERVVRPALKRIIDFFAVLIPMNENARERLSQQLEQAEINMDAREYRAAVTLFTLLCVAGMVLYGKVMGFPPAMWILFGLLGLYAGMVLSRFHLKKKITERKNSIYHQFPDMMDLLSVCVSAGLGFDQSLTYVVERMEGHMIQELDTAQREISMGMPRKEALERFAQRCDCEEIYIFVGAVNQADELGASMKNVLETQAASVRITHKQMVEEKAQKLSVKMMFPMVLFILPVTFIIILGPAVPSIISALGGF